MNKLSTNKRKIPATTFVLDAETKGKLEELAAKEERTMSSFLRWLIQREYRYHVTDDGRAALSEAHKEQGDQ